MFGPRRGDVNNRNFVYGDNPQMGPISIAPVVCPEPDAGSNLAPYRYGGPRKRDAKRIAAAAVVEKQAVEQSLTNVPNEVLYRTFDFLSIDDLRNLSVVCKRISSVATRYSQGRCTWNIKDSGNVETPQFARARDTLTSSPNARFVKAADIFDCVNKRDTFAMLRNMTGVTKLSVRFSTISRKPRGFCEADFEAEFGESLVPQLRDLSLYPSKDLDRVEGILQKATGLERLLLALPRRLRDDGCFGVGSDHLLTRTVGKRLKELCLGTTEPARAVGMPTEVLPPLPDLGAKGDWPNLKLVEYGEVWQPDRDLLGRVRFLLAAWDAQQRHGGYQVRLHRPFALELHEFRELVDTRDAGRERASLERAGQFLAWLKTLSDLHGADEDDVAMGPATSQALIDLHDEKATLEFSGFAQQLLCGGFRMTIHGISPPSDHPRVLDVLKALVPLATRVTIRPEQTPAEADLLLSLSQFTQWGNFIGGLLPRLQNVATLRFRSDSTGHGGDIPLGNYQKELAGLCRSRRLRHLDVDAWALTQPETNVSNDIPFCDGADDPYMAIKNLGWISLPDPRSGWNSLEHNLLNLRSLTLRGIFLHRQTEFIWFTNLTAKLKHLEKLRVHGLVWHAGHDRDQSWGQDGEWIDTDDDDESDASSQGSSDAHRQQPVDDEDRVMNQALAQFFLNDFEGAMQSSLGLTPEAAEQSPHYRHLIASRDAMRDELERRRDDGTMCLQRNPLQHGLPRPAAGPSSSMPAANPSSSGSAATDHHRRRGGGYDDDGDDDDDDGDDTASTDSGFGVDPRFAGAVDEELRAQRLGEWVERLLVATARRTGGACRDVKVTDVKVSAKGLDVWWYRDHNKREVAKWLDGVLNAESLAEKAALSE